MQRGARCGQQTGRGGRRGSVKGGRGEHAWEEAVGEGEQGVGGVRVVGRVVSVVSRMRAVCAVPFGSTSGRRTGSRSMGEGAWGACAQRLRESAQGGTRSPGRIAAYEVSERRERGDWKERGTVQGVSTAVWRVSTVTRRAQTSTGLTDVAAAATATLVLARTPQTLRLIRATARTRKTDASTHAIAATLSLCLPPIPTIQCSCSHPRYPPF